MEVRSVTLENDGHDEESIHRAADHRVLQADRFRPAGQRCLSPRRVQSTLYKWRAKYGGMEADEARRLRDLEVENARLKKLLTEAHLDLEALKVGFGIKR